MSTTDTTTLPTRILVNAVTFHVQVPHESGPHSRYDTKATGSVDRHGHVSLDIPPSRRAMSNAAIAEHQADVAEALAEAGLVEWHPIGQGDCELYATPALRHHLEDALAMLPDGWFDWTASDG